MDRSLDRAGLRGTIPKLAAALAYWVVRLFFIAAAIEQFELRVIADLASNLVHYPPNVRRE